MSHWQLDGAKATFQADRWRIEFDAERPQQGLAFDAGAFSQHEVLALQLPGAQATEPVSECYERGSDIVVTYEQHSQRTVRPQAYVRVVEASDSCVVQLIVSMQTSLLESAPKTTVESAVGSGALLARNEAGEWTAESSAPTYGWLHRPEGADVSFLQAIHPTDFSETLPLDNASHRIGFRLFSDSLEKGVIRRARILAGWTPRAGDVENAERFFERQLNEAPPLTT